MNYGKGSHKCMSAAIHGAEIMARCSWNDSEQITLLHGLNIQIVV